MLNHDREKLGKWMQDAALHDSRLQSCRDNNPEWMKQFTNFGELSYSTAGACLLSLIQRGPLQEGSIIETFLDIVCQGAYELGLKDGAQA